MKVSDILRVKGSTLYTCTPEDTLSSAVNLMEENDIGSLVVISHGKVVGMLSFREVIKSLVKKFNTFAQEKNINFELRKNSEIVQKGSTSMMLWNIDEIVSYVSQFFTLKKGDIIFTGTPKGVAAVNVNDVLEGFLEGKQMFKIQVK